MARVDLVTPKELADEMKVPISTVYRWNCMKTGPAFVKVGKHVRYHRSVVDAWLARNTSDAA